MNGRLNSGISEGLSSTSQIQKASKYTKALSILAAPQMHFKKC